MLLGEADELQLCSARQIFRAHFKSESRLQIVSDQVGYLTSNLVEVRGQSGPCDPRRAHPVRQAGS